MCEQSIVGARASVMVYDDIQKKWIPSGSSSGLSKVQIYHHQQNNTFRVVGRKLQDHEVVINCSIIKGLKYNQATATFHQWRDSKFVYGLNFSSQQDAQEFARVMIHALDVLSGRIPPSVPPGQLQPNNNNHVYDEDMGYRTMTREDAAIIQQQQMTTSNSTNLSSTGSVNANNLMQQSPQTPTQQQLNQASQQNSVIMQQQQGHHRTSSAPPAPQPPPISMASGQLGTTASGYAVSQPYHNSSQGSINGSHYASNQMTNVLQQQHSQIDGPQYNQQQQQQQPIYVSSSNQIGNHQVPPPFQYANSNTIYVATSSTGSNNYVNNAYVAQQSQMVSSPSTGGYAVTGLNNGSAVVAVGQQQQQQQQQQPQQQLQTTAPQAPPPPPAFSNFATSNGAPAAPPAPPQMPIVSGGGLQGGAAPPPPPPPPMGGFMASKSDGPDMNSLAAQLQNAKLRRSNQKGTPPPTENSGSSASSGGSGNYGTIGRSTSTGMASMMDEMAKTLARRRAQAEKKEPDGNDDGQGKQRPWDKSNTLPHKTNSSGATSVNAMNSNNSGPESPRPLRKRFGSANEETILKQVNGDGGNMSIANGNDIENLKAEIMREIRIEINKAKQEIIEVIKSEFNRR